MSTGNRGSQNYDKESSQRVGLQGYISWVFLYVCFFTELVQHASSQIFLFS